MILIDTSVWIDHLRNGDSRLKSMLVDGQVLTHPFVIGEISLGNLRQRKMVLRSLTNLPVAKSARDEEVLAFVESNTLAGLGIGYIDVHLLVSARLSNTLLWTRDRRLRDVATRLELAATP
jgi:predicted nucleic acid-binding protein